MRTETLAADEMIREAFDSSHKRGGPIIAYINHRIYYLTEDGHLGIIGKTGWGKTACGTLPTLYSLITCEDRESFVAIDPKGDLYEKTSEIARSRGYDVLLVNYRDVLHSEGFNVLWMPYCLHHSKNPADRQRADDMLSDIADALYPDTPHADPFWNQAARELFLGLTSILMDKSKPEEVSIASIYNMLATSGDRMNSRTFLKSYVDTLSADHPATLLLSTYVSAPNDTAMSIRSVFTNGLCRYVINKGVKNMMSIDTLNILSMSDEKPMALYIILPDESRAYDALAAMLCSQITLHYIRLAQRRPGGALKRRLNLVLEELASVASSLPSLPHLMAASRSRNMRIIYVLQDLNQLKASYGESAASAIRGNSNIMLFSVENLNTLDEFSRLCGDRVIQLPNGMERVESLLTSAQLQQMPVGQALVMARGLKFVSRLPFFSDLVGEEGVTAPRPYPALRQRKLELFKMTLPERKPGELPPHLRDFPFPI